MDFFKIMAIISPFLSAGLTGLITYNLTMKAKRFDLLYQSKIPAFKDLTLQLVNFKNYCLGQVAQYEGNEYSPYWSEGGGTLQHRTEIAVSLSLNAIYFSIKTRKSIEELMNKMSIPCNLECRERNDDDKDSVVQLYYSLSTHAETCIEKLYNELNLKA